MSADVRSVRPGRWPAGGRDGWKQSPTVASGHLSVGAVHRAALTQDAKNESQGGAMHRPYSFSGCAAICAEAFAHQDKIRRRKKAGSVTDTNKGLFHLVKL